MIFKLKIFEHDVVVTNGIAQTKDKDFEELINIVLDIQGYSVSLGFVPQLFDIFGDNVEIIEIIGEEKDAIY